MSDYILYNNKTDLCHFIYYNYVLALINSTSIIMANIKIVFAIAPLLIFL